MKPSRIGYVVGALVLLASGTYFFVYLYRWEWNRALTAGFLFVAAELGLGIAVILERLRGLNERLDQVEGRPGGVAGQAPAAATTADHFEWLEPNRPARADPDPGTSQAP